MDFTGNRQSTRSILSVWMRLFFCAVGFSASLLALILEHDLHYGEGVVLGCGIASKTGCTLLALTTISEGLFRIPLGAVGAAFFLVFGILSFIKGTQASKKIILAVAFALSVFLAGYSAFVIKAFCFYCFTVQVSVLFLFGEMLVFARDWAAYKNSIKSTLLTLVLFTIGVGGVSFGVERLTFKALNQKRAWKSTPNRVTWSDLEVEKDFKEPGAGIAFGDSKSKRVLHFFGDFKCPFCQQSFRALAQAIEYSGVTVKGVFHPFPQEDQCNPGYGQLAHGGACLASKVALCGLNRADGARIFQFLFESPDTIQKDVKDTLYFIETIGPQFTGIGKCIESSEADRLLKDQLKLAESFGIHLTPTFFLGSRKLVGSPNRTEWIKLLTQWKEIEP